MLHFPRELLLSSRLPSTGPCAASVSLNSIFQVQNDLLLPYCENIISDEEYFILSDLYCPKNLELLYDEYPLFDLESMLNDEYKIEFRFEKTHLPLLADLLQISPMFKCSQGSVADGMEALSMLLKRLSYPCRYADMVPRFGRRTPVLSMVTNQVLDFTYDTHGRRILQWNHNLPRSLEEYTHAVSRKGAPYCKHVWTGRYERFEVLPITSIRGTKVHISDAFHLFVPLRGKETLCRNVSRL